MRYLSLFSGIEACTVAWKILGWEAAAFAQYEPGDNIQFPSQVLKYHYPDVPNLGDVTKITEEQIKALGHIDLVVGGSPCQDLSLAGKRAGLRNEDGSITRSGLFDYQLQIFEWARRHCNARFLLWENVPGAFSSGKGRDFAYILGSMVQRDVPVPADGWDNSGICTSDDWSRIVEWRVLDSQYFGVAQRRRRVFALLDTGAWWSRRPILFEQQGLSGDLEKGEGTQEGASTEVGDGTEEYCRNNTIGWDARGMRHSKITVGSIDHLQATQYKGAPLVGYPDFDNRDLTAYRISSNDSNVMKSPNPNTGFKETDISCTLDTTGTDPTKGQGGIAIVEDTSLCNPPTASGKDVFPTLTSIQSSKIWLGNQEAFSGDYWIMEKQNE